MKNRSSLEICLPIGIFFMASVLSIPTFIIAAVWMTIGVCSLGHRSLDQFPTEGIPQRWLRGPRRACLWFYHLAWWPWYMRSELHEFAGRSRRAIAGARWLPRRKARRHPGHEEK